MDDKKLLNDFESIKKPSFADLVNLGFPKEILEREFPILILMQLK